MDETKTARVGPQGAAPSASLRVTSSAIQEGRSIPREFTGEGADQSPPLSWSGTPDGTRSFALICHDPDAPVGVWYHWVLYNLPAEVNSLPAGLARTPELQVPVAARQGLNSWPTDHVGYRGPMPPKGHGRHRYFFTVYALDAPVELEPRLATAEVLQQRMKVHILAQGHLMGTYERK